MCFLAAMQSPLRIGITLAGSVVGMTQERDGTDDTECRLMEQEILRIHLTH